MSAYNRPSTFALSLKLGLHPDSQSGMQLENLNNLCYISLPANGPQGQEREVSLEETNIQGRPMEPGVVKDAVDRIVASAPICHSARNQNLLRYLVEEECAGRGDRIKAYPIGVDVLGKCEKFDPQSDSAVRVAMLSLRKDLATYNEAHPSDQVRISLVPGNYRPQIAMREDTSSQNSSTWRKGNRIIFYAGGVVTLLLTVLAIGPTFFTSSSGKDVCNLAHPYVRVANGTLPVEQAISRRLADTLAHYSNLTVAAQTGRKCSDVPSFDLSFISAPSTNGENDIEQPISVALSRTGQVGRLWSKTYYPQRESILPPANLMAAQIAYDLGDRDGQIINNALASKWGNAKAQEEYACIASAQRYFITYDEGNSFDRAYKCLRKLAPKSRSPELLALYATIETDIEYSPGKGRTFDARAMNDALDRAELLNSHNDWLLLVKLRRARWATPPDVRTIKTIEDLLDRGFATYPGLYAQMGITLSGHLADFNKGLHYSRLAEEIIGKSANIPWGEVLRDIYNDDWKAIAKRDFVYLPSESVFENIVHLGVAVERHDQNSIVEVSKKLAASGYQSKESLNAYIDNHMKYHAVIKANLKKVVDHDFVESSAET